MHRALALALILSLGALPALGAQYVHVEKLPVATQKMAPSYPETARLAHIQGTVIVKTLVRRDGTVGATKVLKSIPELDEAAVAAVRRWRFKPGTDRGVPVAVWVAIPVKFTLH